MLPRLILQPVVENAVEHDISHGAAGRLEIRAAARNGMFVLEVIHSGHLTQSDRRKIGAQLTDQTETDTAGHIGLNNVHQRLKLLYGDRSGLTVDEEREGVITARMTFPLET